MSRHDQGGQTFPVCLDGREAIASEGVLRVGGDCEVGPRVGGLQGIVLKLHGARLGTSTPEAPPDCRQVHASAKYPQMAAERAQGPKSQIENEKTNGHVRPVSKVKSRYQRLSLRLGRLRVVYGPLYGCVWHSVIGQWQNGGATTCHTSPGIEQPRMSRRLVDPRPRRLSNWTRRQHSTRQTRQARISRERCLRPPGRPQKPSNMWCKKVTHAFFISKMAGTGRVPWSWPSAATPFVHRAYQGKKLLAQPTGMQKDNAKNATAQVEALPLTQRSWICFRPSASGFEKMMPQRRSEMCSMTRLNRS